MAYGKELIIDLIDCDEKKFNRKDITKFMRELCNLIEMERHNLYFWDYEGVSELERDPNPKTYGTSAIQFIMESNITIHCLDKLRCIYLNIFSCKEFEAPVALKFCKDFFKGKILNFHILDRL